VLSSHGFSLACREKKKEAIRKKAYGLAEERKKNG
jgi:hypothetical protein